MKHSLIPGFSPTLGVHPSLTSNRVSRRRWIPVLVSALALMTGGSAAWAAVGSSTSLNVTPVSPASGDVMSMKAVVTSSMVGVPGGTVTFTDLYNGIPETLGTIQVQSANGTVGTAVLNTAVGGVGVHKFTATFNGDSSFTPSSSSQSVTFTGPYLSATALTSTGAGPYTLTGAVSAYGPSAPTGSVTFTDTTTNFALGTVTLDSTTLKTGFTPYTTYPISVLNNGYTGSTSQPAIGDFNGDGRPDYAVPANGGTVVILLGAGNGTFTNGTAITTGATFTPSSVVISDFNGDGKQDMAVLNAQGTGSVNIYLGNGDGTFQTPSNFPVAGAASASRLLAVGDFNQDGIPDLVASNSGLNNVAVLLGTGSGSFGAPSYYGVEPAPWNIVVGDVNNDGIADLAVASDGAVYASILIGKGDGTFINPYTSVLVGSQQVGSVALGDFNNDGWLDLATTSGKDNNIYILLNKKTASPTFAAPVAYSTGTGSNPYHLTIGDFDRDGNLDVISANTGNATVDVLLGTGTGTLNTATPYAVGGNAIFATEGDINGDDRVDLTAVISTTGTSGALSVLLSGQSESATASGIAIHGCGKQSVAATYGGDSNYGTSTSPGSTFTPTTEATTLTLSVAPPNGAVGTQVMLQATLSPYNYGSTTTNGETVTFYNNGVSIGTAALSSGVATLNYTQPAVYSYQAKYTADCNFQASSSSTISGTAKLSSTINWPTPAAINYGTALSATQLNATDTGAGAGTFVYTPAAGTKLPVGPNTLSVVFTPNNAAYGQETDSVTIMVNSEPTVITWPTPSPISYGTPLSSFQLDAVATLGPVNVDLSSYYNVNGIYSPATSYSTRGYDNDGYSYSTSTLSSSLVWNGLTFNIGPPNALDAVANTTIALPAGNYTNLYMLGAMVNNVANPFTFTVNYTDGTSATTQVYMSDWVNAAGYSDESVISCAEDRNYSNGTTQADSICVYGYSLPLDQTKIPLNVVLPATRNIVMLSMDLTTPEIPGTYVYTPQSGTVEPVGTDTLSVLFTPTSSDYASATGTVKLVVGPAVAPTVTTTISWPMPAPITYGTPLSPTQLDAVAMAASRPTPASLSNSSLLVLSTSTDGTSYALNGFDTGGNTYSYNSLNNGSVNFAGATFTLGSPDVPNAMSNGAVYTLPTAGNYSTVYLIGAAVNGQTNVPFTLTYQDGNGNVTDTVNMSSWKAPAGYAGEAVLASTKYEDTRGGGSNTGTFDLYGYQIPADPTRTLVSVTLPATRNIVIMGIGFGTNQAVTVPGTYKYTPDQPTVLPAGIDTLSVSFTPTDPTAYTSATGSTTIEVDKAKSMINWPQPAPVVVGTTLSSTQLDATATTTGGTSLPGMFVYTPKAGMTYTSAGTYTLSVVFTPTDATDYSTATASVQLIVGTGNSSASGASTYTDCCFFAQPTPYTVTIGGANNITPTGTVQVVFNGNVIGSGTLATTTAPNAAASMLLSSGAFYPGPNSVTLKYLGDSSYSPNTAPATIMLRNPAILVNPASRGSMQSTTIHYQFAEAGSMNYNFAPQGVASEFTDGKGTCQTNGVAAAIGSAGFDCTFIVTFTPTLPGTRKGVIQVNFTNSQGKAEPTLYLFLSGQSGAAQLALSSATQITLNSAVSQPQGLIFNPTDANSATLYVANSKAAKLDTLPSGGGSLTQWNTANTTKLVYPADLIYDAFDNLVVPDVFTGDIYSYAPTSMASTTLSTNGIVLGAPTQARFDNGGYLYIADAGNTAQIVGVPGEAYTPAVLNLGGQSMTFPQALAVDNNGTNLFVGDGKTSQVLQISLNGNGGATNATPFSLSPCDATVTSCAFKYPAGFAFNPNGDMYVIDRGARLLKIPNRTVTPGALATLIPFPKLVNPAGITLDGSGNIYVTDLGNFISKLAVTSGALKFPSVGSTLTTTVTNTGNLPLTSFTITLGSGTSSSFTESDNCPVGSATPIAPGSSCTITLKYAATKGFDTLTIKSNAFSLTTPTIALSY